ncbi:histidinol-phosphatase HisJ [Sedimentibacter hydroxybenzoicus DSM 7310]|uniref:Histidinol-phosphatase n=1 Tax=Sedimentibacter hydroxybenzoicus DSM 7310 TaxID=1123245 RepID=A0A974BMN1_SEDHY|nr:histidinol-phosphatase HisJ [Sedimentibacter hydroxybenzoicus]NYB75646.1 histidinol-phosphatase HisJ [Sedimentibacter hydroxybenzoicus DSM 7310]
MQNLHTHTLYCDGKNSTEEMIQAAIKRGFDAIGISTHGPVPFASDWNIQKENIEAYIEEVNLLKEKYKNEIKVYLGMEMDYIPGAGFDEEVKALINRLDYYIGSVHYLGKLNDGTMWTIDYNMDELSRGINESYNRNIRYAVEAYYNLVAEMAINYEPPIIGHIDLIKKLNRNNILFDENEAWYRQCIERCLNIIRYTSSAIEINTGGMARGYTEEQYPSTFILKSIEEKNIPVIINSDAHTADGIDYKLKEMYELVSGLDIKICL